MKTTLSTVSNSRIFVDTNILYYGNDLNSVNGKQAITHLRELQFLKNRLYISSQILREYTNLTMRNAAYNKLDLKIQSKIVQQNVVQFQNRFNVIYENADVLSQWLKLLPQLTTHKDIFDFYVAATLSVYNIPYILTHNESDFTKFSDFITVIPLFPK